MSYHKHPYPQKILYEYNLNGMYTTFYEWWEPDAPHINYLFANVRTPMNILIKFDPDKIEE